MNSNGQGGRKDYLFLPKNAYLIIAQCSYSEIYISRKIRPCLVDLEGQFQTTLQVKDEIGLPNQLHTA